MTRVSALCATYPANALLDAIIESAVRATTINNASSGKRLLTLTRCYWFKFYF